MVNGRGGPRDPAGAAELFERAAGKGHVGAMFALGMMRGGDFGVARDSDASLRWLRAAADRGHEVARQMVDSSQD
ncbi:tetratricopeptide repeat protein, partial [Rhizobiaceae sp. 2RAB30]